MGPRAQLTVVLVFVPEITTKKRKLGKNPDVDTSFLPDRDREVKAACPKPGSGPAPGTALGLAFTHALSQEEENRLREELRQEWEAKQEKIKSECWPSGVLGAEPQGGCRGGDTWV